MDTPGTTAATIETDVLVIGAGPVGLFQVFEFGLLGLRCHVVDVLPSAGGQCRQLYPDKPIYDIPAVGVCTGRELSERLLAQAAPFAPEFHFGERIEALRRITGITRAADGTGPDRWGVRATSGREWAARVVVIAAGAGAFEPRRLKAGGLDAFERAGGLHYTDPGPAALAAARHRLVIGDDEAALQMALQIAALHSAAPAAAAPLPGVTLLHRRDEFRAEAQTLARFRAARASGTIAFVAGQVDAAEADPRNGTLQALRVLQPDGSTRRLPADCVVAPTGVSPKLGPIADWGLAMERRQLVVDPATFQTVEPGLHAVGDVVTYPGKRRLILSGFHEATLAAYAAAEQLAGAPVALEYTTTSRRVHRALGVLPAAQPDAADAATAPLDVGAHGTA